MATTPNMMLLLPIPTITLGPTYASENNDAFDLVDSHDHTTGKGVPIPASALNINADLSFNGFNASVLRSTQFQNQTVPLTNPSDINSLYVVNGDLFYNNSIGQSVQITSGAAIDATTIGGIGGDYATSTALVFYTSASRTFTFWSNTNVPANLDAGSVTLRPIATGPNGITLNAPNSLPSSYNVNFPSTLPASTNAITIDQVGNLAFSGGGVVPPGSITMYGGVTPPAGYVICDGSAISRTGFSALFTAISTAYGVGNGTTTFNIPDLRGLFPRGVDGTAGNDPDSASRTATNGGNAGNLPGSFQADQIISHTHIVAGSVGTGTGPNFQSGGALNFDQTSAATGGLQTNPKNVYVNFIIKT